MPRNIRFRGTLAPDNGISEGAGNTGTSEIADLAVTTGKIAADAVTDAKLADHGSDDASRAVGSNHIKSAAVITAKIADDAVDATKLKDDASIDANRAVTTDHIRDLAVTTGKLAADAVDNSKIADSAVSLENIDAAAKPVMILVGGGIATTAGGDANESITVSGMLETDTAVVFVQKAGASPVTVDTITPAAGQIDVVLSANPSNDHKLGYFVFRAAA